MHLLEKKSRNSLPLSPPSALSRLRLSAPPLAALSAPPLAVRSLCISVYLSLSQRPLGALACSLSVRPLSALCALRFLSVSGRKDWTSRLFPHDRAPRLPPRLWCVMVLRQLLVLPIERSNTASTLTLSRRSYSLFVTGIREDWIEGRMNSPLNSDSLHLKKQALSLDHSFDCHSVLTLSFFVIGNGDKIPIYFP